MTAHLAYLDPGSGSMIIQVIVGGAAAVAVIGRLYWRRAKRFFRIGRSPGERL